MSGVRSSLGLPFLIPSLFLLACGKLLELWKSKARFMLKILFTGFPDLSLVISVQSTLEMCAAAENCQKHWNPLHVFRGCKVEFNVDTTKSWSLVLVIVSNMFMSICNRFNAKRANRGKIKKKLLRVAPFTPSFEGNPLTHAGKQNFVTEN